MVGNKCRFFLKNKIFQMYNSHWITMIALGMWSVVSRCSFWWIGSLVDLMDFKLFMAKAVIPTENAWWLFRPDITPAWCLFILFSPLAIISIHPPPPPTPSCFISLGVILMNILTKFESTWGLELRAKYNHGAELYVIEKAADEHTILPSVTCTPLFPLATGVILSNGVLPHQCLY